jgi:hypothetical protein
MLPCLKSAISHFGVMSFGKFSVLSTDRIPIKHSYHAMEFVRVLCF